MATKTIGQLNATTGSVTGQTTVFEIEIGGTTFQVPLLQVKAGGLISKPVAATFGTTSDNAGSSSALSVTDNEFGIRLSKLNSAAGNTNQWGSILKSVPVASTWTATALIRRQHLMTNFKGGGLVLRESATGKIVKVGFTNDSAGLAVDKWTNGTTFSAVYDNTQDRPEMVWVRVKHDNATTKYNWGFSFNGDDWCDITKQSFTDFFTTAADQVGFGVNGNNAAGGLLPCVMDCLSYAET